MPSGCLLTPLLGLLLVGDPLVYVDQPNEVRFTAQSSQFVRLLIHSSSTGEPCVDELEVYGPDGAENLALKGRAAASSCLAGYAQHAVAHLNDGRYGNQRSWIAASTDAQWCQIELTHRARIDRVVYSRDRERRYGDRVPLAVEVLLSDDGRSWRSVARLEGKLAPVALRTPEGGLGAGLPAPPPPPGAATTVGTPPEQAPLEEMFLAEEHAWLKTFGRADLSSRLVPYNGRVDQYPRHVADDELTLVPLAALPRLDGQLDDPCWRSVSRGVVRVAHLAGWAQGPLVSHAVSAGYRDQDLFVAVRTDRWLSRHLATVARGDGALMGLVVADQGGLTFNRYQPDGTLADSQPLDGRVDWQAGTCEFRAPLARFPEWEKHGLRIGLGIGGHHTSLAGRGVQFRPARWGLAAVEDCQGGVFHVRLFSTAQEPLRVTGSIGELSQGRSLAPGQVVSLAIPAQDGPIGPHFELQLRGDDGAGCRVHLFRYDPLRHALALWEALVGRLAARGLNVAAERAELAALTAQHARLLALDQPDLAAERAALRGARVGKRRLMFRDPDLAALERLLFVKRHPFLPSHIYTDYTDAPFRPGGGVCVLEIPRAGDRLEPERASQRTLFDARGGIARDPVADFAAERIYFSYRDSEPGYYHLMSVGADGGGAEQLTRGVFHDFYPCPLPDGDLAFISTRCTSRVFCFRGGSSVLFRSDARGQNPRPLSLSSLSEWAPSVMRDGRLLWTRWEYQDKGADFTQTLWAIRPDGTHPELVFGNTIVQPNGYAGGREMPGSSQICCTLVSHFGDLNGPIALVDVGRGRMNPGAIRSLTPEVPWPGMWPHEECFRDPFPLSADYVLCAHAPREQFGLAVIDRHGNREMLYLDPRIGSMAPTPLRRQAPPPTLAAAPAAESPQTAQLLIADVHRGLAPDVPRGKVKYLRVVEEVRHTIDLLPGGEFRKDHDPFMHWYATPVDRVSGPYGWPTYVAKAPLGIVEIEEDGSAHFQVPAGRNLYFQALDAELNELQRMRSVVHFQPGERRGCVGCHEGRHTAPPTAAPLALRHAPRPLQPPSWGAGPFSYQRVVQPVWNAHCVGCHDGRPEAKLDLTARLDADRVPASYRALIEKGWVHYVDCGWNSGGCEKRAPLSFGTLQSKLWKVLDDHHGVRLSPDERHRVKCWTDLNCPLWPDYQDRTTRPLAAR